MKRAILRLLLGPVLLYSLSCGSDESPESSHAVARKVGECDLTPIDDRGTLPACAAGKSSPGGPGTPIDWVGSAVPALTQSVESMTEAATIDAARNSDHQSPVDRGFGRPSTVTP